MPTSDNKEILITVRGMDKKLGTIAVDQAVQTEQIKNLVARVNDIHDSARGAHKKINSLEKSKNIFYGAIGVVGVFTSAVAAKAFGFISGSG